MMFSVESINQLSNRSLTDRTQDSDSCNVGSIPAGALTLKVMGITDFYNLFHYSSSYPQTVTIFTQIKRTGDMIMSFSYLKQLPSPSEIKEQYPLSAKLTALKAERDKMISDVITGKDNRFLVIIGSMLRR